MKLFASRLPATWLTFGVLGGAFALALATGCSRRAAVTPPWVNRFGMTFVVVAPGTFLMGDDSKRDESPAHTIVFRSPYWIQTTELTQDQWKAVMGTTPWVRAPDVHEGGTYPATHMSWLKARAFVDKLNQLDPGHGYRLPSEAEWERVCETGDLGLSSFGREGAQLGEYAWTDENAVRAGERYAHAVARKKPNALGVFDIHGNVWEWCQDNYRDGYADAPNDGGPRMLKDVFSHVYRGGGWISPARSAACSVRAGLDEDDHTPAIGMRIVASHP
jgi:formylglycine-generating enzyme required for sulfatase activity